MLLLIVVNCNSYVTTDDKDWLLKYLREDGSPVKTGKGSRKRKLNPKNVISESESDTEKQVRIIMLKVMFPFRI